MGPNVHVIDPVERRAAQRLNLCALQVGPQYVQSGEPARHEAETAVGSRAAKTTCFARGLLRFHRRPVAAPTPMLGDNQAMYRMVTQEGATSRTRYYERATMLIKRAVLMLLLQPYLVPTTSMIADLFTKALEKGQYLKLRDVMMNHHAPLRDALSIAMCQMHGSSSRLAQRLARQL